MTGWLKPPKFAAESLATVQRNGGRHCGRICPESEPGQGAPSASP